MANNLATVQQIYEAFGRGDIPFILGQLAEDVQWEQWAESSAHAANVPWLAPISGRDNVVGFFQVIGSWKINHFAVTNVLVGGNQVAATIEIEAELPTGATLRDEEMHLWTFDDTGKVTHFRHYSDTAKHIAAARAGAAV
jgi:uncharacterized protein